MSDDKERSKPEEGENKQVGGQKRHVERKKSPEGTTGILRVDCSKPRRSSGSSVDFRGVPDRLTTQGEPTSPQPSVDRLSVTFAERSDCSESSVKVNIFDPGSPPSQIQEMDKVRFCNDHTDGEEEEDDYSASVSVIMQRRESMKRASSKRKKRRASSPLPDLESGLYDTRRRSSEYTNSSGDTAISMENGTTQEQIFENIRLHKEVLSNVKLQPWGMRRKIKLVQQAKAYVKRHEGELQERLAMSKSTKDILARFNIWMIKKLQYLKRELANTMTLLIPWELRIKEIESHFGSAVASYFTFLRWMFWVNFVIAVVLACFVSIPEMLTADVEAAGERKTMLPDEKLKATNLLTLWDIDGVLKYTPMFYGYYTNKDGKGTGYRLPLAYFLTGLAVYIYSFVATLKRMAENSRMSKLSEKDDECVFTWKVFTGWDFMIGNSETAHNRVASLVLGFKEALLEETEKKKERMNWKIFGLRVFVNLVIVGLLALSAYIVYVVVERSIHVKPSDNVFRKNEITICMVAIAFSFPNGFEFLSYLEGYHPRKSLRIQLARIMVLNFLNLYTLIFSQFMKISTMTLELQSLKKNYTSLITTTISTIPQVITTCEDIPVNCSNGFTLPGMTYATPETSPATSSMFLNISGYTPFMSIENLTIPFSLDQFSNFTDIFNVTYLEDFFNVSSGTSAINTSPYSSSTSSTEFGEHTTESNTESDSTIPLLFTIIADIIKKSVTTAKSNVTDMWKNLTEMSHPLSEIGNESKSQVLTVIEEKVKPSEVVFDAKEIGSTVISQNDGISIRETTCYVKKCEDNIVLSTPRTHIDPAHLFDMETRKRLRTLCWETMFGQEMVKLTIMDLLMMIGAVVFFDFIRAIVVKVLNSCCCWDLEKKFPGYGNFKIAENILQLVHNQGMIWMGMFFAPGLPAMNLIKLVIIMYLRSWAVLTCNVPTTVVFRASRSNNFYLALLLMMLFLCVLPVGFAIVWVEPSWHCGPFSDYERIYHLFTKTLQKALPKPLHKAFDYIASPGIIIPLLMLLILIIYYLVSLTNSLREANNDLKTQLRRERTEERRKMFQMVNKRARKGSKDSETPFAKWKKLIPELAAKQMMMVNDIEKGEKNENEVAADLKKEMNKKEILARLMKKALRKSSGTSDEDSQFQYEQEIDQQDSLFEEKELKTKNLNERKGHHKREPSEVHNLTKENKPKVKAKHGTRHGSSEKVKSKTVSQTSSQRSSLPEKIPVIKISKIESEEYLLKDENGKQEEEKPKKGKERFIAAVEKFIKMRRKGDKEEKEGKNKMETKDKDIEKEKEDDGKQEDKKCPMAVEEFVPSELDLSTDTPKKTCDPSS